MRLEQRRVVLVVVEERPRENVAQQQHDAQHLVRLDAARDDPLREVSRVRLQRLDAARLEGVNVVVVDGCDLCEDLLGRHHREQLGVRDASCPLLPQLRAVLAQVLHQLMQQLPSRPRAAAAAPRSLSMRSCVLLVHPHISPLRRVAKRASYTAVWRAPSRKSRVVAAMASSPRADAKGAHCGPFACVPSENCPRQLRTLRL